MDLPHQSSKNAIRSDGEFCKEFRFMNHDLMLSFLLCLDSAD
jgi:hypothetical protein